MSTELPLTLQGVTAARRDAAGLWTVDLDRPNELTTACGTLTPRYSPPDERRRAKHPLTLYADGTPKSVSLECQTVVKTPLGDYPAELVTFYADGALKRLFILDGQISGFWSEADEEKLLQPVEVPAPWGPVRARLIGLCFYPSGALRSLTLWPGERITVPTPAGSILVRTGFSLYEDGALESVEPAEPVDVATPMGVVSAYDDAAVGVQADRCSLCFGRDGQVSGLTTSGFSLLAQGEDGSVTWVQPQRTLSMEEDGEDIELPLRLDFREGFAVVRSGSQTALLPLEGTRFQWLDTCSDEGGCGGGCANCSACATCSGRSRYR